jgi:hypothetical protein
VVTGYIVSTFAPGYPVHQVLHHFHMTFWPVPLAELPNVDNVTIQYDCSGIDAS